MKKRVPARIIRKVNKKSENPQDVEVVIFGAKIGNCESISVENYEDYTGLLIRYHGLTFSDEICLDENNRFDFMERYEVNFDLEEGDMYVDEANHRILDLISVVIMHNKETVSDLVLKGFSALENKSDD